MNKRLFAILVSLAFSPALADSCIAADPPGVRFRTIDAGFAEARATGRPLLLFFTADWCLWLPSRQSVVSRKARPRATSRPPPNNVSGLLLGIKRGRSLVFSF